MEETIASLRASLDAGERSAGALASAGLARVESIDRSGPELCSVIEVNPDALAIAESLDRERAAGRVRGPLHGIPLLVKDNLATADAMQTTAGSLALLGARAPRDAFVVRKLREAGAVLLGKANLSEWANIRSPRSTSGWSARGGLTRNPHAPGHSAGGSSSGSAAAVAAGLCAVAIGTETDGSIVCPASMCGVVGMKPTVGRVSRDGIVPISHTQDTAGPMARCVADAALVLAAIAGPDPRDAATHAAPPLDLAGVLDADGLRGARLGVVANARVRGEGVWALFEAQVAALEAAGAVLVRGVELPRLAELGRCEMEVLLTELRVGLDAYLAEFGDGSPVASLADVIAFNEEHREREMPHFGQEFFLAAQAKGGLENEVYRSALTACREIARDGLDAAFARHRLDALVAPTAGLAGPVDFGRGDVHAGSISAPPAVAGYPHLTVPMGFVGELPAGLSFIGPAWADARVLRFGYAYEQATRARRAPECATRLT